MLHYGTFFGELDRFVGGLFHDAVSTTWNNIRICEKDEIVAYFTVSSRYSSESTEENREKVSECFV